MVGNYNAYVQSALLVVDLNEFIVLLMILSEPPNIVEPCLTYLIRSRIKSLVVILILVPNKIRPLFMGNTFYYRRIRVTPKKNFFTVFFSFMGSVVFFKILWVWQVLASISGHLKMTVINQS